MNGTEGSGSRYTGHYWHVALLTVVLLIMLLGVILWWTVYDAQRQFNREAAGTYQVLMQRLQDNVAVLGGLAALHHAVDDVDYDQLSLFARKMLASYPHIYAIHYLVRVPAARLTSFQNGMREEGYLTYQVREYLSGDLSESQSGAESRWQPVSKRPVYYPVVFIAPLEPEQAQFLGYDVYADTNLKKAIDTAVEGGRIVASAPYDLVQGGRGYVLFKPVYVGLSVPVGREARFEQATRITSLLIRADRLITRKDLIDPNIHVSIFHMDDAGGSTPLARIAARQVTQPGWWSDLLPALAFERHFDNAGQSFRLVVGKPLGLNVLLLELLGGAVLLVILTTVLLYMRRHHAQERRQSQELLYTHQERTAVTLLSIEDAVITADERGNVDHMNAIAERLTHWSLDDARGRPVQEIFCLSDERSPTLALDPVTQCLREGHVVRLRDPVVLRGRDDTQTMVDVTASPIRNHTGSIIGSVLVFHDVSNVREMQDRLAYQASHDALTGLLSRREFEHGIEEALQSAKTAGRHHALCYMDIDQFKVINDSYGHAAGDELLVQLSALLLATVRGDDTLARLGGDEFAVLLWDCSLEKAEDKADDLRRVVEEFRFVWHGKTFDVGFGIGVVPINANSGAITDVLRAADAACYAAKAKGRHQIFVYKSNDPELEKRRNEMRWATRIGEALRNHRFQLYFQAIEPVLATEPGVFHCELLMRSEDEHQQLVSPETFIPAAERYNLMTDIDRWVVSAALPKIALLDAVKASGETNICGINLSGQSLSDESFYDYVVRLIETHEVNPASICFEITETAAIVNFDVAVQFVEKMKMRGCRFALDDFGTGVSSFTYLKRFPLDYVKIDGSFVRNLATDPVDYTMVEAVTRIARVMGIKTIAEFVEDEAILDKLRELGVDYAQGYEIARPAPLTQRVGEVRPSAAC